MHLKSRPLWETSLLYATLVFGMLPSSILTIRAEEPAPTAQNIKIENPLGEQTTTIQALLQSIISQLLPTILLIAVVAIIVVGFKFVVAAVQGDSGGLQQARKNLLWVLIGTAIVVGAWTIATAAITFFKTL